MQELLSCDVERSFLNFEDIFIDKSRKFIAESLEEYSVSSKSRSERMLLDVLLTWMKL